MSSSSSTATRRDFIKQAAGAAAAALVHPMLKAQDDVRTQVDPATPTAEGRVPVIDCHCHVGIGNQMFHESTSIADPEEAIHHMNEARIDQSAIFAIQDLAYSRQNLMAAYYTYARYPGRFIGFARHDGRTEKGRIRDLLRHEVHDLGLRGLGEEEPNEISKEAVSAAEEFGIPVIYHANDAADQMRWARDYPHVNFILCHLGGSPGVYSKNPQAHLDAIAAAQRCPNVYLDLSTVLETKYLALAIKEAPPTQVVFGSDAPDCDVRLQIWTIRRLNLPKETEEAVLGGNYLKFLDNQGHNRQWKNNRWLNGDWQEWMNQNWDIQKTDEGKDYSTIENVIRFGEGHRMTIVDSDMYLGQGGAWWFETGKGWRRPPTPSTVNLKIEPSQVLDAMSKAGISRACVTALSNPTYAEANRYVADACAQHPDKLIGIAVHAPADDREGGKIRKLLTTEVLSMGMRAVRSDGHPTRELLDTARDLNIPVLYLPVVLSTEAAPVSFFLMCDLYPDVNFIIPQMGLYGARSNFAAYRYTVDYLRGAPNVYLGTAAQMYIKMIALAARVLPPEKLLFGSCGPYLDPAVEIEKINILGIPHDQHAKIMSGNILRLLKLA